MPNSESRRIEIMQQVLEPLLEDFIYWFDRCASLFEKEKLSFMAEAEQADLLDQVREKLKEVKSARALFKATGKQVGIDVEAMVPWHQLLMECQAIAIRHRRGSQS